MSREREKHGQEELDGHRKLRKGLEKVIMTLEKDLEKDLLGTD